MTKPIGNPFLYDASTRFLQEWHRRTFGPRADALDVDLLGRCHDCYALLYAMEATSNPEKHTEFLEDLARRLGIAAFLFRHDAECTRVLRISWLGHGSGDEEFGKDAISSIRERHSEICPNRRARYG